MQAHLDLMLTDGEAGEAALNNKCGQALRALGLVGHGKDDKHICNIAVGDEDFAAIEDIVVALQTGLGQCLGGVGAGVRLGQRKCTDLAAGCQHGQILCLLLGGAVCHDGLAAQAVMCGNDITGGGAILGQLLNCDGTFQGRGTTAAVLLRDRHTHNAQVEQFLNGFCRILGVAVGVAGNRLNLILSELGHHLLEHQLLFRQ